MRSLLPALEAVMKENYTEGKKVSGRTLSEALNIKRPALRTMINYLRMIHVPIASDPSGGYWYERNNAKLIKNAKALQHRVAMQMNAITGMIDGANDRNLDEGMFVA